MALKDYDNKIIEVMLQAGNSYLPLLRDLRASKSVPELVRVRLFLEQLRLENKQAYINSRTLKNKVFLKIIKYLLDAIDSRIRALEQTQKLRALMRSQVPKARTRRISSSFSSSFSNQKQLEEEFDINEVKNEVDKDTIEFQEKLTTVMTSGFSITEALQKIKDEAVEKDDGLLDELKG